CCELRGDLVATLSDLYVKRRDGAIPPFGRVLIETTGLADPVPILQTLITDRELASLYRLDSVVTLVDGVHGEAQLESSVDAVKQAALADRLLISKADVAPAVTLRQLEARLGRLNPGAEMFSIARGSIEPQRLFGAGLDDVTPRNGITRWLNAERFDGLGAHGVGHGDHGHHSIDTHIRSFCVCYERPVTSSGLVVWLNLLAGLRGANLLRVKGLLNVEGRPVVVQAVQTLVHEPVTLEKWPDAERRSRLVFITRDMERSDIEKTLAALAFDGAREAAPSAFDAEAYARFVAVAGNFR
ncbi:MAG TPA: GTP-binding protein, partial [Burkholderiales bacterium]|nr:GTP-binding protein [Burkholderiales bacterium]